ncbi:MAG: AAA family ATPase [Veillonellaceae bacterium]|nr:AAA family ATPase [Veillonellaceae bacterium]
MGQIITLASGKGGVGKTIVTGALGAALAEAGRRVLLLDCDMGLRDLDLVLGMENRVLFDVFDVATGRCFEQDAILPVREGLDFLPASQKYRWEEIEGDAVLTVLEDLREEYDYLIVDSPAGIGKGLIYTLRMADEILLVAEPTWVSVRDTSRVMSYLHEERLFRYAILGNNFPARPEPPYLSVTELTDSLQAERLAGVLPHSRQVLRASQAGQLADLALLGEFATGIRMVAADLIAGTERSAAEWEAYLARTEPQGKGLRARRGTAGFWRSRRRW